MLAHSDSFLKVGSDQTLILWDIVAYPWPQFGSASIRAIYDLFNNFLLPAVVDQSMEDQSPVNSLELKNECAPKTFQEEVPRKQATDAGLNAELAQKLMPVDPIELQNQVTCAKLEAELDIQDHAVKCDDTKGVVCSLTELNKWNLNLKIWFLNHKVRELIIISLYITFLHAGEAS